jgi:Helicase associated domain
VSVQRKKYKAGTLNESRKRRLEELGFLWDALCERGKRKFNAAGQPELDTQAQNDADYRWDLKFAELQSYRAAHGHCNVPYHDSVRPSFWQWFNYDSLFRLSHFPWLSIASFIPLERRCFQENPVLGHWVSKQRHTYKTGTMDESRKRRLQELGFLWDAVCERGKKKSNAAGQPQLGTAKQTDADYRWDLKFAELQSYRAAYGHCNVPFHDSVRPCVLHWFNCFSLFQFSHFPWLSITSFPPSNVAVFRRIQRSGIGLALSAKNTRRGQWTKTGSVFCRNWVSCGMRDAEVSKGNSMQPDNHTVAPRQKAMQIVVGI